MDYSNKYYELFTNANKDQKHQYLDEIEKRPANEELIPFLIDCLADQTWSIRKHSAKILQNYGDKAFLPLSNSLNSRNPDVQHWSLHILGNLGSKAYPSILRAMKSSNDEIRYFACILIGEKKISQGISLLLKALGDEKWRVRKAASDALVNFGDEIVPQLEQIMKVTNDRDIIFWTIKTLGKLGSAARKFLLEALKSGNKQQKYLIAAALGESGDVRVIKVLIESLADHDWSIRKAATLALGEIGEKATDLMLQYLASENPEIRDGCIRALSKSGESSLRRMFEEIIKMDENKRYLVRGSMVKIGSPLTDPLLKAFDTQVPEMLTFAAAALGEIGSPRAVPVLIKGLANPDWNVRRTCAYALTEIGEKGVDKIAEALKSDNEDARYWVTKILESIGDAGAPYLAKALKDPSREIRFFAAKSLGKTMTPDIAKTMLHVLDDPVWSVRKAAAESLIKADNLPLKEMLHHISSDNENIAYWFKRIISESGHKYVRDIIEALRRGDSELRIYAAQAAGLISAPDITTALILALNDDSEWVRIYAAISLGNTGDERAIIPLIKCFSDRNKEVHRTVLSIFEKIGPKVQEELKNALASDNPELKSNAVLALAYMKEPSALDEILLLSQDNNPTVRLTAIEALGSYPSFKTRAILADLLRDNDRKIRIKTARAFAALGQEEDVLTLIQHAATAKAQGEAQTIQNILAAMARQNPNLFANLMISEQSRVQAAAFNALVSAGLDILPRLTQITMESQNDKLAEACRKVITEIKQPRETFFYAR